MDVERNKKRVMEFMHLTGLTNHWKEYISLTHHKREKSWAEASDPVRIIGRSAFTFFLKEKKGKVIDANPYQVCMTDLFREFMYIFHSNEMPIRAYPPCDPKAFSFDKDRHKFKINFKK